MQARGRKEEKEGFSIVKEYEVKVDGLDHPVKGKVLKYQTQNEQPVYSWVVSHYCKPVANAPSIYIPSRKSAITFTEAEHMLLLYLTSFTTFEVELNKEYEI